MFDVVMLDGSVTTGLRLERLGPFPIRGLGRGLGVGAGRCYKRGVGSMRRWVRGLRAKAKGRWRAVRLGWQLFWIVSALSLAPLLLSNLWAYLQSRAAWTQEALRNAENVAQLEATGTQHFVERQVRLLRSIAGGRPLLRELQSQPTEAASGAGHRRLWRRLRQDLLKLVTGSLEEIVVLSPRGSRILSTRARRLPGEDLSGGVCFRGWRHPGGVAGFEVGARRMTLLLSTPIQGRQGNRLGFLCGSFRFEPHDAFMEASRRRVSGSMIYLVDKDGKILGGSFLDLWRAPLGRQILQPARRRILAQRAWMGRYERGNGSDALAAYAPIPGLGWGVLVEVPAAKALAVLDRLGWYGIWFGLAVALCLVLVVFAVARSFSDPIRRMAEAARRIARGGFDERVLTGGSVEIADLGQSFNRMGLDLKESYDLLERRVEARTAELTKSQEFTQLLLDSVDLRIVVLDPTLRILKANRAAVRMHGEEIVGKPCYEAFEGASAPCDTCPARKTLADATPAHAQRRQHTVGGEEIVDLDSFPVWSPSGEVEAVVEIGRVVTEEKRREAQLIHQEKMAALGLLSAGVAHDIGNPLASIQSQLRMAKEYPRAGRTEHTLEVVEREIERIDRLVREVAQFSRRRRQEPMLASIPEVIEDVIRLLSHDPRARAVAIEKEIEPGLPGVRATEDHLMQVLLNLGINALDAMPDGGALRFEAQSEGGIVSVRLCDTGTGMASSEPERIFESFFTTKAASGGTGLGLFVSRQIIESLGGRLELERTGAGGSAFVVQLPAVAGRGPEETA